jgi:hypothetical protein
MSNTKEEAPHLEKYKTRTSGNISAQRRPSEIFDLVPTKKYKKKSLMEENLCPECI